MINGIRKFVKEYWPELVIFVFLTGIAILWCSLKTSFQVDESLSFALSNHPEGWVSYNPYGWFEKSFFANYGVTDSPFNYGRVYNNQYWDVHPPLYYYLLHTICSLFPYRFSIWFGLIINIVSYVMILIFIDMITNKLSNNRNLSILVTVMYGLNKYVLDCVIFIRMYMLSSLFVLMFVYFALNIIDENKDRKSRAINYLGLFFTTICGGLTHYHFYIFIGITSLFIALYLIINKRFKTLMLSFFIVISSLLINLFVIFPGTFKHFESDHAETAFSFLDNLDNLKIGDFINKTGGLLLFIFGIVILLVSILYVLKNKINESAINAIILLSSYYLSFVAISILTEIISNRYFIPIFSLYYIGVIILTYILFENFKHRNIIMFLIVSMVLVQTFSVKHITMNYGTIKSWEYAKNHQHGVAVVVTDNNTEDYEINELFTDFRWYYAVGITQLDKKLDNSIEDNFVLYIEKTLNDEEVFEYIQNQISHKQNINFKKERINKNLFNVYSVILQ